MKEENILYLYDNLGSCIILYVNKENKTIHLHSKEIMKTFCFRYGRSMEEIRRFVCRVLKIRQKVPILLDVKEKLIFFPVYSLNAKENIWISYAHIKKITQTPNACCEVYFKNGVILFLPCERRSIQRQRRRCRKLLQLLKQSIV